MSEYSQKLHMSDNEIIQKILDDNTNFSILVDRYSDKLSRYIQRMSSVSAQDREDLLQNVFIKVYINLNDFDDSLSFNAWIYRISHNEVIDFVRREKNKQKKGRLDLDDDIFVIIEHSTNFLSDIYRKEDAEKINKIFSEMTPKYREILLLRFIEDYSYRDISDILQKPESNITTMIHRAKKEFRKIYEQNI